MHSRPTSLALALAVASKRRLDARYSCSRQLNRTTPHRTPSSVKGRRRRRKSRTQLGSLLLLHLPDTCPTDSASGFRRSSERENPRSSRLPHASTDLPGSKRACSTVQTRPSRFVSSRLEHHFFWLRYAVEESVVEETAGRDHRARTHGKEGGGLGSMDLHLPSTTTKQGRDSLMLAARADHGSGGTKLLT